MGEKGEPARAGAVAEFEKTEKNGIFFDMGRGEYDIGEDAKCGSDPARAKVGSNPALALGALKGVFCAGWGGGLPEWSRLAFDVALFWGNGYIYFGGKWNDALRHTSSAEAPNKSCPDSQQKGPKRVS